MADEMDRLLLVSGTLDTTGIGASPSEKLQNVSYAFQSDLVPAVPESPVEELEAEPPREEQAPSEPEAAQEAQTEPEEEPVRAPVERTRKTAAAKAAESKEQADKPAES
jgi:hypothetical protein